MVLLKITAYLSLLFISYDDFRERKVYWFLFPIVGFFLGIIHFNNTIELQIFLYQVLVNFTLVTLVLILLYLIVKLVLKKTFLNHSLGLGDILFFYAFACGFPTITFLILFVNSIVFSLLFYLILRKRLHLNPIPLAGIMSLFVLGVFVLSTFIKQPSLYYL